jgi:hypothetical protein
MNHFSVVDQSVILLKSGNDITKEMVIFVENFFKFQLNIQ